MSTSGLHSSPRQAFTLIELLVVIAIIAILAVVVLITLNPAQLLAQSRDANRVSDLATMQSAINLYNTDQSGSISYSLGAPSTTYISFIDLSATSTAGTNCGTVGLPATTTGWNYQCPASSTYRSINGQGWLPVNFSSISAGTPFAALPVDPTNNTSSLLYYEYMTNGSQYALAAPLESTKYLKQDLLTTDVDPSRVGAGSNPSLIAQEEGLVGYWNFEEGGGMTALDQSGSGNNGTWNGTQAGTNGYYTNSAKVGNYAGYFDGTDDYVSAGSSGAYAFATPFSFSLWMNENNTTTAEMVLSEESGGASTGYFLNAYSASVEAQFAISSTTFSHVSGPAPTFGTWEMVTVAYDGTHLNLYLNGSFSASTTSVSPLNPSGAMVIGETQRGDSGISPAPLTTCAYMTALFLPRKSWRSTTQRNNGISSARRRCEAICAA